MAAKKDDTKKKDTSLIDSYSTEINNNVINIEEVEGTFEVDSSLDNIDTEADTTVVPMNTGFFEGTGKKNAKKRKAIILSEKVKVDADFCIPTGSFVFDYALNPVGGFLVGGLVEITAPTTVGKTHVALLASLNVCGRVREGGDALNIKDRIGGMKSFDGKGRKKVLYCDFEQSCLIKQELISQWRLPFDSTNVSKSSKVIRYRNEGDFIYVNPGCMEETEEIIADCIERYGSDLTLVVIDSLPACLPRNVIQPNTTLQPAVVARESAPFVAKLMQWMARNQTCCLILNQFRTKLNFINPAMTRPAPYGGIAFSYYYVQRIELKLVKMLTKKAFNKLKGIEEEQNYMGEIEVRVTKNKHGANKNKEIFFLEYGVGYNDMQTLISVGETHGIIDHPKGTARYTLLLAGIDKEGIKFTGVNKLHAYLKEPENKQKFLDALRAKGFTL